MPHAKKLRLVFCIECNKPFLWGPGQIVRCLPCRLWPLTKGQEDLRPAEAKSRRCLVCGRYFDSPSAGHRRCPSCTKGLAGIVLPPCPEKGFPAPSPPELTVEDLIPISEG